MKEYKKSKGEIFSLINRVIQVTMPSSEVAQQFDLIEDTIQAFSKSIPHADAVRRRNHYFWLLEAFTPLTCGLQKMANL